LIQANSRKLMDAKINGFTVNDQLMWETVQ